MHENQQEKYQQKMWKINHLDLFLQMKHNPVAVIDQQERAFCQAIAQACAQIVSEYKKIILLTGPSSSGKTTAAKMIERELTQKGHQVYRISLDNFYRPHNELPRWSDGFVNYESIEGLDLHYFNRLIATLKADGRAMFPVFDFHTASRSDKQFEVVMEQDTHIIFEGIHALNPLLSAQFSDLTVMRLYVSVHTNFVDADQRVILSAQELRLIRRILRDNAQRNASPLHTLTMWDYVLRGEAQYIHPFCQYADMHIDATHCYEPYAYHAALMREIAPYLQHDCYGIMLTQLQKKMQLFCSIDPVLIPPTSLIQEFIG